MLDTAMSTPKDDTVVVIPSDMIALGHDEDGLPKAIPAEEGNAAAGAPDAVETPANAEAIDAAKLPKFTEADLEDAKRTAAEARAQADQLRKEREEAEAARTAAEKDSFESKSTALRALLRSVESDRESMRLGISNWESAAEIAKRNLGIARDAGDVAAEAEAIRAMQRAETTIAQLRAGESGAEQEISKLQDALSSYKYEPPKPREEKRSITPDDYIAKMRSDVGSRIADWFNDNREFITNPQQNQAVMAFANYHAMRGKALNSESFIKALSKEFLDADEAPTTMAKDERKDDVAEEKATAPQQQAAATRRTAAAAPVSRSPDVFSSRNLNASQVKLPPKLAQFVKEAGLNYEKYALETVRKIKSGELPKNFLDSDYNHDF